MRYSFARSIPASLAALALLPAMASAGAWPREKGSAFLSFAHRYGVSTSDPGSTDPIQYTTLFFEYGVTDRITLGFDAGHSVSGAEKLIVFAGVPVMERAGGQVMSVELGLGQIDGAPVIRPGLSFGYGFSRGIQSGWFAADALAEIAADTGKTDLKLDLTYGIAWPSGLKYYAQFQTGQPDGSDAFARIAGAVVLPPRAGFATEIGVEYGIRGDDTLQIKLGIWREF